METLRINYTHEQYDDMLQDAPQPGVPNTIFGVESDSVQRAAEWMGPLATHAPDAIPHANTAARIIDTSLDEVLSLSPLLEQVVQRQELTQEDVRPYRAPLKQIARNESTLFTVAEKCVDFLSALGIHSPKRWLNNKVEQWFIEKVPAAVHDIQDKVETQIQKYLPKLDKFFDGGFDVTAAVPGFLAQYLPDDLAAKAQAWVESLQNKDIPEPTTKKKKRWRR